MDETNAPAVEDPTDLSASRRGQARRDAIARRAAKSDDDDLRWLMGNARGRRFVWRLLDRAGVFRSTFSTNAMQMSFAEGMRNEGLRLIGQIHLLCPETYPVMLKEATDAA